MMKLSFSRNTLIALVVIAVLLLVGAYYLFGAKQENIAVVQETTGASDVELRFLTLASSIQPLVLDTTLLHTPRFMQLTDIRVPVSAEAAGRTNPFAAFSAQE